MTQIPGSLAGQGNGGIGMRKLLQRAGKLVSSGSLLVCVLSPSAMAQAPEGDIGELEVIVVTAPKTLEPVREIPGSISAFSDQDLQELGAQSMADYVMRTPGVVFNGGTPGNSTVTIRGISTGLDQGQGTTGYFINEVSLTDPGFSIGTPDIDTFDVESVTILRGPQGTLFGSGSLGGAVNYQAAGPELTQFDGRLQATVEGVEEGGTGDAERLMVNLPLVSDKFGVRVVYSNRDIAGYIDNLGTGEEDSNWTNIRGGRFLALWQPTPETSVNYLYLEQTTETHDSVSEDVGAGSLSSISAFPETSEFGTRLSNLRLDHEFSFGTLTAMATRHWKDNTTADDATVDLAGATLGGAGPVTLGGYADSEGTTFEVRLASTPGGRVDYLIGAMHDSTDQKVVQFVHDPGSAAVVDLLFGAGAGAVLAPGDVTLVCGASHRGRGDRAVRRSDVSLQRPVEGNHRRPRLSPGSDE